MRSLVLTVLVLILAGSLGAAAESGVNEEVPLEGTGIDAVSYQNVASAGEAFSISVNLSEETRENGTTVSWITLVCINSGVCYSPETHSLDSEDGETWTGGIVPDDTVSYVSWKFILNHEDGSQTDVPEDGFGWKIWSDCWHDNGTWGGSSTDCQDGSGSLPGFPFPVALASTAMAALMARRD
ncbi:MAG: hypothetical protein CMA88_00690 [Euryarchaeota archaeon]|mgnify:CR=1 FL=1|nr:hypothetical protein [Euryarchaeota archaeon]|tara:strand:- start:1025 stop:1573 length:549 start_codon:yes stop_codon:yes gene_type:complete